MDKFLEKLEGALPPRFDFYHLGAVELQAPASPPPTAVSGTAERAVAFSLAGDARGLLVLLFPEELDGSIYAELGNVIAGRVVTELASREGLDLALSPPRQVGRQGLARLLASGPAPRERVYLHRTSGGRSVRVRTLLVTTRFAGVRS